MYRKLYIYIYISERERERQRDRERGGGGTDRHTDRVVEGRSKRDRY